MPIFELKCESCGHEMETICSHDKLDSIVCPKCEQHMKRKWSTFIRQYAPQYVDMKLKDVINHYRKLNEDAKHSPRSW